MKRDPALLWVGLVLIGTGAALALRRTSYDPNDPNRPAPPSVPGTYLNQTGIANGFSWRWNGASWEITGGERIK